jgi:hypothetical protein
MVYERMLSILQFRCFTKPVYQILEMKAFADSVAIRVPAFKIICTAAKSHGQTYSQTTSLYSFSTTFTNKKKHI